MVPNLYAAECINLTEDLTITESTIICKNDYYFNDTNSNGVIFINEDNVFLDCNFSSIIGNNTINSVGIKTYRDNITIKNCNLSNYNTGIWIESSEDSFITNISLFNISRGIYLRANDGTIVENVFTNESWGTSLGAITAYLTSNVIIKDSFITHSRGPGIYIMANSWNNTIIDNTVYQTLGVGDAQGIVTSMDNSSYNSIINNTINFANWNGIDIGSHNNSIINNTIINSGHHGIDIVDTHPTIGGRQIQNNTIIGNVIIWNEMSLNSTGIYLLNASYNTIKNNTIINVPSDRKDTNGWGIVISGGEASINNLIENNYIINSSSFAMLSSGENNSFISNRMANLTYSSIHLASSFNTYWTKDIFTNNRYDDKVAKYYIDTEKVFSEIEETSEISHAIEFFNFAELNLTYDGIKKLNIHSRSVNLTLSWPNNDIYDANEDEVIASGVDNYTLELEAGDSIIVGNFVDTENPIENVVCHNVLSDTLDQFTGFVSLLSLMFLALVMTAIYYDKELFNVNFSAFTGCAKLVVAVVILFALTIVLLKKMANIIC
jgi:hypothetical protein